MHLPYTYRGNNSTYMTVHVNGIFRWHRPFDYWHSVRSGFGEWCTLEYMRRLIILATDPMGQITRIFTVFIVASPSLCSDTLCNYSVSQEFRIFIGYPQQYSLRAELELVPLTAENAADVNSVGRVF